MVYQVEAAGIGEEHQAEIMVHMHQVQVEDQDIYIHLSLTELRLPEALIHQHNHLIHCEALREMLDQVLLAQVMTDYFIWLFKSD
jgi:DNA-binding response OmpR family regulator